MIVLLVNELLSPAQLFCAGFSSPVKTDRIRSDVPAFMRVYRWQVAHSHIFFISFSAHYSFFIGFVLNLRFLSRKILVTPLPTTYNADSVFVYSYTN